MKKVMILLGLVALVTMVTSITFSISSKVPAANEPTLSYTTKVVEPDFGVHGSIWRFRDGSRECYFNSVGGIWCTD